MKMIELKPKDGDIRCIDLEIAKMSILLKSNQLFN
jgi:hypothetical protein